MHGRVLSARLFVWGSLFVLCVSSRLLTTIYYIEDIDSLRFALSMVEYDVGKLQPHFPAYPVFCFLAKLCFTITGRFAIAFSLIGGVSTFFIIYFALKIAKIQPNSLLGMFAIIIAFMNPLLWLMSNRYMPDVMGVACLLASFYFITTHKETDQQKVLCQTTIGFLFAGILLGIRLSYIPFLLPALLLCIFNSYRLKYIIAATIGILVWLIPLLWFTGWNVLITVAQKQTFGHFSDFGGTVSTNYDFFLRVTKLFESLIADGFGLYWIGRHTITAVSVLCLITIVTATVWKTQIMRLKIKSSNSSAIFLNPIFLGCVVYLFWIFLAQNIIYKSRHVLPIIPILALAIAFCCYQFTQSREEITIGSKGSSMFKVFAWSIVILFFFCYCYVSLHTVFQHMQPTTIAQVHRYLHSKRNHTGKELTIVSVPLIKYYLASQDVSAHYITIKDEKDLEKIDGLRTGFVVIGSPLPGKVARNKKTFYHNPYVNRMWSELSVYEY